MKFLGKLKYKFDSYILSLVRSELSSYFESTENKKDSIPDEYTIEVSKNFINV